MAANKEMGIHTLTSRATSDNFRLFHQEKTKIDYLSVSQIETFQVCPLHYKLRYIYKIPTPISASQSFGISIHETLKNFYLRIKEGDKPTEKLIRNLLKDSWVKGGFSSKVHENKFFEKGKMYLFGFLKEGFNSKIIPVSMEQRFILPLPGINKERPLKIGGVMDRVDLSSEGSIEIVDYKTGATIPSQKEVDKNLQLTFYALAASSIREEPFNKEPDFINLSLYFLDTQDKFKTKRTKKQLGEAVNEIYKVRKEIEESDFKCSGNILCEKCEFSLFCKEGL